MSTSRREFLKTTMIASASVALHAQSITPKIDSGEGVSREIYGTSPDAAGYTRGVGIYPGAPDEDFSPILLPDTSSIYRNLALLCPAYHSSAYDYNLTAQSYRWSHRHAPAG